MPLVATGSQQLASKFGASPGQPQEPATLVQVQVLRALAAGSVALRHAQWDAATLQGQAGLSFQAWNPIPWSAGVDIFFVISGLIMVHSSQQLFGKPGSARLFLARRIARIVPLYWATITLYLGMGILAPRLLNQSYTSPWFVAASYFFIPAARPNGVVQPVYELGWTLNYEMFFYALFAVAIVLPLRRASTVLLAVLVALVVVGQLAAPLPQPFAFWTDPILLEFALGVMIGISCVYGTRLGGFARLGLAATGLAALMLAAAFPDVTRGLPRPLVYGLPAAMIVSSVALVSSGPGRFKLLARWGAAAGDASFALYLLHPFVIRTTRIVFWQTGLGTVLGPWAFVVAALAASFAVGLISYRCFERPLTRYARRLLGVGGGKASPVQAAQQSVSLAVR